MTSNVAELASWEVDVIALQETRLSNIGQMKIAARLHEEEWQTFFGKGTGVEASAKKIASASNAANGGVALLTKTGVPTREAPVTAETVMLRDLSRW